MTMVWCRAVWMEGGAEMEDAVPYRWVDEEKNILYWPRKKSEKYIRCAPDETWRQYELMFVKQKDADKKKCQMYASTTDFGDDSSGDSEPERSAKPVGLTRKRNRKLDDDFLSGYSSDSSAIFYPIPPAKRVLKQKTPTSPQPSTSASSYESTSSSTIKLQPIIRPTPSPTLQLTPRTAPPRTPSSSTTLTPASTLTPATILSPATTLTPLISTDADTVTLRRTEYDSIMEALASLKADVQGIKSTLDNATRATIAINKQYAHISSAINTPEHSVPKFNTLEEVRKEIDPEQRNSLFRRICAIGGHHHRQSISFAMKSLIPEKIQSKLNMKGHGGKVAFTSTDLYTVIKDAMMHRHKTENATERDIFLGIADHLKHAPQRLMVEQKADTNQRDSINI